MFTIQRIGALIYRYWAQHIKLDSVVDNKIILIDTKTNVRVSITWAQFLQYTKYKATIKFLNKAKAKYQNKFKYRSWILVAEDLIEYECPIHGKITQSIQNHLRCELGCPKCSREISVRKRRFTKEEFIHRAQDYHGNKYDYSKVIYQQWHKKVEIICPKHGSFWQTPSNHVNRSGCPHCVNSSGEQMLSKLFSIHFPNINIVHQKRLSWLGKQSLDFYFEDYNIAVEFDGKQHFEAIDHFGGVERLLKTIELDTQKNILCADHGCKLFRIKYNYTDNDLENLINTINNIINQ